MLAPVVQPNSHVALLMPSGLHKLVKAAPGTTVSLGKFGSFPVNLILGRPFHLTFELLDVQEGHAHSDLRVVPASELHAETLSEEDALASDSKTAKAGDGSDKDSFDLVGEDGQYIIRNNRLTVDDPSRQALSMDEIELLKKSVNTGSGKDIIARIMQSHSALDEKTAFSLAKYTLRKSKKYIKRFTLKPLDINTLVECMLHEQEPARILELRPDLLGLVASWSNVHYCVADDPPCPVLTDDGGEDTKNGPTLAASPTPGCGRWLVVDDVRGLLVGALAERMDLLHYHDDVEPSAENPVLHHNTAEAEVEPESEQAQVEEEEAEAVNGDGEAITRVDAPQPQRRRRRAFPEAMSATDNTITLIHTATQPNLSLLEYFGFNPHELSGHPLHSHLKTLNWLQMLQPQLTASYAAEPPQLPEQELKEMKPSKRGVYYRRRRRWQRTVRVIDETRQGGFDGLVIAGLMQPESVLHHLVPLVRGGGQIVVYSPSIEPLTQLADAYSSARKTAFLNLQDSQAEMPEIPGADFPLDPRLVLAPTLQTARAKEWQVLPGRTHPLMTGRGGSEGYIFTGIRVLPSERKVEARGVHTKRRKVDGVKSGADTPASASTDVEMKLE